MTATADRQRFGSGAGVLAKTSLLMSMLTMMGAVEAAFDQDSVQLALPTSVGTMTEVTTLVDTDEDGIVPVLIPLSEEDKLVTLNRVRNDKYVPVGRSYDGYDWERVAGPDVDSLDYVCAVDGTFSTDKLCQAYLPVDENSTYFLTTYDRTISDRAGVARFLERTSFGTTPDDLDAWNYTEESAFANWVNEQIAEVGVSSHREYYRKRLNPRSIEAYRYGVPGKKACEAFSHWRRFAFTEKDLYMSQHHEGFDIEVSTVVGDGGTGYVLSIAGNIRTVLTEPLQYYAPLTGANSYFHNQGSVDIGGALDMSGATSYKICALEEMEGIKRPEEGSDLPRTFAVIVGGVCSYVVGGNPTVNLDASLADLENVYQLDLGGLNTTSELVVINDEKTMGSDLLLTVDITDPKCETFPDPTDNDFRGPDDHVPYATDYFSEFEASKFTPDAPVFALLPDGTYAIHDYRLDFDENTIESPMMDGGGTKATAAAHDGEQVTYCTNVRQNIFNEDNCKLSYEQNACASFDAPLVAGLTLDETAIISMQDLTDRSVYAVTNLRFDSSILPGTATNPDAIVSLPCNVRERSRWVKVAVSVCEQSTVTLNPVTYAAFEKSLVTSTSRNSGIIDIFFNGNCHSDDVNKYGMTILAKDEGGKCYQNVHPDHLSIYDVTVWLENHVVSGLDETGFLNFPDTLDMSVWQIESKEVSKMQYVGRHNDDIDIKDLPEYLQASTTTLDQLAIFSIQDMSESKIFAIDGLKFDDTSSRLPCTSSMRSRWIPVDTSECDTPSVPIDMTTEAEFAQAIYASNGDNPFMRDIEFSGECFVDDATKVGMVAFVDEESQCYKNVHPDHMSVYDVTEWVDLNGLNTTELNDTAILVYPDTEEFTVAKWETEVKDDTLLIYVGRYGDDIPFESIPEHLRTTSGTFLETTTKLEDTISSSNYGTIVCGSPGEVAPDPYMDDYFDISNLYLDSSPYKTQIKQTIWTILALTANDQLRQKVAWALSQIFIISPYKLSGPYLTEVYMHYYDIFVRNAFNNYRDVFREVSFHPKMARYLSFAGSNSIAYRWQSEGKLMHPDENYARECFQLFSIGLVKLNMDGTPKLDRYGTPIKTYDSKDIVSFARAWTGFWYSHRRANYEDLTWIHANMMDPMVLDIEKHDLFPKRGLDGKYIGDRFPRCEDLPERAFLRKGAKYRLLGGTSSPKWQVDDPEWDGDETIKRVVLSPGSSQLYAKLCNTNGNTCDFPTTLVLDTNLDCDGTECNVDTVRVIQVANVFYEYIRQPCVQAAFYEGGKKVIAGWNGHVNMCANPKMAVATELCCSSESNLDDASRPCEYLGERLSFTSNQQRCTDNGLFACDPYSVEMPTSDGVSECKDYGRVNLEKAALNVYHWTTESCALQMLVKSNGLVAILHDPNKTHKIKHTYQDPLTAPHVNIDSTMNYFSIHWEKNITGDDVFPSEENGCGNTTGSTCTLMTDQYDEEVCLCSTLVTDTAVFSEMPTREQVLSELTVGAFEPDMFNGGDYEVVGDVNGVEAFRLTGTADFTTDTIFKVASEFGETIYLKNVESTVQVGGKYNIRNPPNFMDIVDPEVRDAYYEVEAVLDHYVRHDNTAPFVSKLLIQRFGISNPSPRYVETVATAFQAGAYESQNITFGDGKWGNLGATVAAILLDREATSTILDADPAHGSIREPLLKVVGFMRSMDFTRTNHSKLIYPLFEVWAANSRMGQMVWEAPDVFSFFAPDNVPAGGIFTEAGLVAPEAQSLTLIATVGIANGLFSMVRNGLNSCGYGFGVSLWGCRQRSIPDTWMPVGYVDNSIGYLAFSPTSEPSLGEEVIDELATLITSGRLSDENKEIIVTAYDEMYGSEGADAALKLAQQLIVTSPEFHATNLVRKTGGEREVTPALTESNGETYKAIVYVMMFGGLDSFYMLTPHFSCDLYQDYAEARGVAKLETDRMLSISAPTSPRYPTQPCSRFGVNDNLPIMKELYDLGMGAFLANAGHMSKPVTKFNYFTETKVQLFSHSSMEAAAYAVDPFLDLTGTGVLGRMLDVLEQEGYLCSSLGINIPGACLNGDPIINRPIDVIRSGGQHWFYSEAHKVSENVEPDTMKTYFNAINGETSLNSGLFGNHWSQKFVDQTDKNDAYSIAMMNTGLTQTGWNYAGAQLGPQLATVSKLILAHESRGTNRDIFYVRLTGFDSHHDMAESLDNHKFPDLNTGIEKFYKEMDANGMLNSITFVLASEFGRTISPNSGGGTDHAWGGNYFLFGGEMKGGAIYGQYPESFGENDPTNDGRGRLIPTTSWDMMWNGISQWFGITSDEGLNYVLPNRENFGCRLFTDQTLYNDGKFRVEGCAGDQLVFEQEILLNEARYLTGQEQKAFCKEVIVYVAELTGTKVNCVVIRQNVKVMDNGDFALTFATELTADEVDYGNTTLTELNEKAPEIVLALGESGEISNMTGVATDQYEVIVKGLGVMKLETGIVTGVSTDGWTTVTLSNTYDSMVVVATPVLGNYTHSTIIPRIRNAAGNSFQVMGQNPYGRSRATGRKVHYMVIEEGVYDNAVDIHIEAFKVEASSTSNKNNWNAIQQIVPENTFTSPVVTGQVMSYNDPKYSVFYSRGGGSRQETVAAGNIFVGKHSGSDATARSSETLGVIVFEAGSGWLEHESGVSYFAMTGDKRVMGVGNNPPYNYNHLLPEGKTAILSQTGMNGYDGSWPVLFGTNPVTSTVVNLASEEDGTDRRHTAESVHYVIFD